MNDERKQLTADEARAREALRSIETPAPDAAFRARLRGAFIDGSIAPAHPAPTARPGSAGGLASLLRWLGGTMFGRVATAAATAAIIVVVLVMNQGPAWQVTEATGQGVAVVDGRPIPMSDLASIAHAISAGSRVRVPDGCMIELRCPGQMAVRLTSGTDATVPRSPRRWFARNTTAFVQSGIMRITTGPRFHGARLEVDTPVAAVELHGTTIAVISAPEGTCVCVLEGGVKVGRKGGTMVPVESGMRRYVYSDERAPYTDQMLESEKVSLTAFRAEVQSKL